MNQLTGKIRALDFTPGHPEAITFQVDVGDGTLQPAILDASVDRPPGDMQAKGGPDPDTAEEQWMPLVGGAEVVGGLMGGWDQPFDAWARFWFNDGNDLDNVSVQARFILTSVGAPEPTEEQWA